MVPPLEVAVFSPSSALLAQLHGAARIELNAPSSYPSGGLSPSLSDVVSLSPQLSVPLRVMVRPRGPPLSSDQDDFVYTADEYEVMRQEIRALRTSGALNLSRGDGFVFGIVERRQGRDAGEEPVGVDVARCAALVDVARPFPCVFHRAFDPIAASPRWRAGLEDLQRCRFRGLLTAGGTAADGFRENLARLQQIVAMAGSLEVVIGGGVRHGRLSRALGKALEVQRGLPLVWLHTAALRGDTDGGPASETVDKDELRALLDRMRDISR